MEPADIQCALKKARTSQSEIARKLGVSPTTVTYVVTGKSTSRRIATAIADATGLSLDALWPGRYPSTQKEAA
ncbi:helix-turn-helix domain-containing protein [Accumulibacter sp.]|jgi:lambda repressor-like predicted transcriptional regulator|uniref:helix-turn-helix domain-containing protein n=1 Tax=Accumulibacter sp. TaxID=2053492 RepID=UPI001ACB4058|nr:helix-turn-helix domain-containing protein [Accumulibacter sp.]MBN8452250.1 helix-turn-helix domain-containing protein [Accumulibacter sp.]